MQIRKIVLLLLLVVSLAVNVFAAGPLEQEIGSISVSMRHDGSAVGGGTLTAYQVASVIWQNDHYEFVYTQDFLNCELPLDSFNNEKTVYQFAEYAAENNLIGITQSIDTNGSVRFTQLPLGLYLVVQLEAADGYFAASPFLISVPIERDGKWEYDVDASPKVEIYKEPAPTEKPSKPGRPSNPDIPQSGQLKWPIPVLSVAGLALFVLGWVLCFRKKERR